MRTDRSSLLQTAGEREEGRRGGRGGRVEAEGGSSARRRERAGGAGVEAAVPLRRREVSSVRLRAPCSR